MRGNLGRQRGADLKSLADVRCRMTQNLGCIGHSKRVCNVGDVSSCFGKRRGVGPVATTASEFRDGVPRIGDLATEVLAVTDAELMLLLRQLWLPPVEARDAHGGEARCMNSYE